MNSIDLLNYPLGSVERFYQAGVVSQAQYEAYMHLWATSAVRYSSLGVGWQERPTLPDTLECLTEMEASL